MRRATLRLKDGQVVFVDLEVKSTSSQPRDNTEGVDERHTVARDKADVSDPSRTDPYPEQRGAVAGIVLRSANLSQCAAFYAKLLGAELPIREGTLKIAPWLMLRQADRPGIESPQEVVLAVPDLDAVIKRMNANSSSRRGDTIWLRDPDGRAVFINQMKRGSPASSSSEQSRSAEVVGGVFEVVEESPGDFRVQLTTAKGEVWRIERRYDSKVAAERSIKTMRTVAKVGVSMESATEFLDRRKQ
jgi:hypothetical protein